jgi:hypothetical protein
MIQKNFVTRHPLPTLPSLGPQNSICVMLSASARADCGDHPIQIGLISIAKQGHCNFE